MVLIELSSQSDLVIPKDVQEVDPANKFKLFLDAVSRLQEQLKSYKHVYNFESVRPGVQTLNRAQDTHAGNWTTSVWSGGEVGFRKKTFQASYVPEPEQSLELPGIDLPIREIKISVLDFQDEHKNKKDRLVALTLITSGSSGQTGKVFVYNLSLDLSQAEFSPVENGDLYESQVPLTFDQAIFVLDRLNDTFSQPNREAFEQIAQ